MSTTTDLAAEVRRAVEAVPDPEMPPVTIGQLGMVVDVAVDGDRARIQIMPTFSGCPATAYIGADAEAAATAVQGVTSAEVVWRRDLSWGPERITDDGQAAMEAAGIAPPGARPERQLLTIGGVRCPWCGSRNTRGISAFGPAPCRSSHACADCKTPFDAIKDF